MLAEQYRSGGPQRLYQADAGWSEQVKSTRKKLAELCGKCMYRMVRVETVDGEVYEGMVVGTSGSHLYLAVRDQRFFSPWGYPFGYGSFILPLVLYDLLVLTLLI